MIKLRTVAMLAASTALRMPSTFEGEGGFDFPDEVTDINAVPERARGLYEQSGDKFVYKDVTALKNALTNAKNEKQTLAAKAALAAKYEKLGKTPEEIEALVTAAAEAATKEAEKKGDWEALKQQMETNHAAALDAANKRGDKYKTFLERTLRDDQLRATMAEKDIEGNPLFLLPAARDRVKIEETDDGFTTVVLRSDGTPMLNADNKPATLKDLLLEFKSDSNYAGAFKGLGQSGGGATSGDNKGGGGATKHSNLKRSAMSPVEKVKFIREHGQAEYDKLAW